VKISGVREAARIRNSWFGLQELSTAGACHQQVRRRQPANPLQQAQATISNRCVRLPV